ncbi:MAG: aquaporin NIP [Saprospiraceae bacterium]|jgi:aquaporin NIP|tara:strand:- start:3813 stop:4451 length:639 start_codon:yes stop_codon:yes gene_type:complete
MKQYIAELIGTFALVFCGTGSMVINEVTGGDVTHVGIGITWGMIVMAMIYTFGKISGAHINPAVTIAFACTDRFDKKDITSYIIAQLIGAFLASAVLTLLFPDSMKLGATLPAGSWQQSFILEIILTYFLMLVVLFVGQNNETKNVTGFAVGAVVMLEAIFAGPITGASMNPARSIAPAIISGNLTHLWIYILAPIIGAVLATYTWLYMKED